MWHSRMITILTLCLTISAVSGEIPKQNLHDNSPKCNGYVTDGFTSAYYTSHQFFDFRNIDDSNGVYDQEPANVTNDQNGGFESSQQGYLSSTNFTKYWKIQNWGSDITTDSPIMRQNSPQNIYIQKNTDDPTINHLTLRSYRQTDFVSTAEVENKQRNLFHSSIRLRARVYGASGAVAGMFTYLNDTNESDIEILTRDPKTLIRYSNQPSTDANGDTIAASETDINLPDNKVWTDWHTHRIDWLPEISSWYVDGIQTTNKSYGVPQLPSFLSLNMWGDGSEWSGNMSIGEAAYLQIQWIEMVYNTSGPVGGYFSKRREEETKDTNNCKSRCTVDGTAQPGFPELIQHACTNTASNSFMSQKYLNIFTAVILSYILYHWI